MAAAEKLVTSLVGKVIVYQAINPWAKNDFIEADVVSAYIKEGMPHYQVQVKCIVEENKGGRFAYNNLIEYSDAQKRFLDNLKKKHQFVSGEDIVYVYRD